MSQTAMHEHVVNAIKDAPPLTIGGMVLFGYPASDWVLALTAIYTIIRIVSEVRSWYQRKRDDRNSAVLADRSTDVSNK